MDAWIPISYLCHSIHGTPDIPGSSMDARLPCQSISGYSPTPHPAPDHPWMPGFLSPTSVTVSMELRTSLDHPWMPGFLVRVSADTLLPLTLPLIIHGCLDPYLLPLSQYPWNSGHPWIIHGCQASLSEYQRILSYPSPCP